MPMALGNGVFRILFWVFVSIFSLLRPDLNVFPTCLDEYDEGHVTYISAVRLTIARDLYWLNNNQNNGKEGNISAGGVGVRRNGNNNNVSINVKTNDLPLLDYTYDALAE